MKTKTNSYLIFLFLLMGFIYSCTGLFKNSDVNITDPKTLIEKYQSAKNWQGRLLYVLDSSKVKPYMEEYYRDKSFEIVTKIENFNVLPVSKDSSSQDSIIKCSVTLGSMDGNGNKLLASYIYYLKRTNNGLKIDWLCSVGYNTIKLNVYKATKPSEAVVFRLHCKISDYYNYGYRSGEKDYYSVDCETYENSTYSSITGYALKNSEVGSNLFEILKDGNKHPLTLALKFDYKSEQSSDVVRITDFISDGWYYNPNYEQINTENLFDYIINTDHVGDYFIYEGYPNDAKSHGEYKTIIQSHAEFDDEFIIDTKNTYKGRTIAIISEYCHLTDESLEVYRRNSNSVAGKQVNNVQEILIKFPTDKKALRWEYSGSDGTKYLCSSEFTQIDYNGILNKAIKVTEKNTAFPSLIKYRYYLKGIGFYMETVQSETNEITTVLRLESFIPGVSTDL